MSTLLIFTRYVNNWGNPRQLKNSLSQWHIPRHISKLDFCKSHFALSRWKTIYPCLAATTWIWILFRFRERKDSSCQGSSSQFGPLYLQWPWEVWLAGQQAGKATNGKLPSWNQNKCMMGSAAPLEEGGINRPKESSSRWSSHMRLGPEEGQWLCWEKCAQLDFPHRCSYWQNGVKGHQTRNA